LQTVNGRVVHALLQKKGHSAWVELTLRYGKTFRSNGLVLTCEPEVVRALLTDKAHTEVRSVLHKLLARFPGANGILFLEGEPWLKRVKAVMPAFHRNRVDGFAPSLRELTLAHARRWENHGLEPDLFSAVQQLGAESVLKIGYGLDPSHPLSTQLAAALIDYKQTTMSSDPRRRLDEFGAGTVSKLPWLIEAVLSFRKKMAGVREVVRQLAADNSIEKMESGWQTQLTAAGLSEEEVALEVNHLYGAFNAIDYIVTAALYELARNPRLMAAIQRELDSVVLDDRVPVRDSLSRMPLLHGFMLEILRMYPVSMGISRRTGDPLKIGGEQFPAGTEVLIILFALHHHPDFWNRPTELLPERWAVAAEPKVPFSYAPFLDGPRKCIGRSMAEMQLQVVLSTLLQRYDIQVFADAVIPPFMLPRFAARLPFALRRRS
jgi:cytochrome P450